MPDKQLTVATYTAAASLAAMYVEEFFPRA